ARALPGKKRWSSCFWFLDAWKLTAPSRGRMAFPAFDSKNGLHRSRDVHAPFGPFGDSQTRSHCPARGLDRGDFLGNRHSALPFLMTSSESPKLLRRVEQSLLPGGGSNDVQPAQMATRMASDDDDRLARRLEPAEARRLALGRLVESLLAELVEERVSLAPQL